MPQEQAGDFFDRIARCRMCKDSKAGPCPDCVRVAIRADLEDSHVLVSVRRNERKGG